jgi:hypothetical protein
MNTSEELQTFLLNKAKQLTEQMKRSSILLIELYFGLLKRLIIIQKVY